MSSGPGIESCSRQVNVGAGTLVTLYKHEGLFMFNSLYSTHILRDRSLTMTGLGVGGFLYVGSLF